MLNGQQIPDAHDFDDLPTGVGMRVLAKTVTAQQAQLASLQAGLDALASRIDAALSIARLLVASVPVLVTLAGAIAWAVAHVKVSP
jgi:hypothetical protein